MTDLNKIKLSARETIRNSVPSALSVSLVFVLVLFVLNYLKTGLTGVEVSENELMKYYEMVQNGQYEKAIDFTAKFMPSEKNIAVSVLIDIVEMILGSGFIIFILNMIKQDGSACYGNLLDGFAIAFRVIFLSIIEAVIIMLLSMLFFVPGIIAAYCYRQALFLIIDHPEMGVIESLKTSREIMKGHKMELFTLDLSFLGWYFLEMIPFVSIWVKPYTRTSYALYYKSICNEDAIPPAQMPEE